MKVYNYIQYMTVYNMKLYKICYYIQICGYNFIHVSLPDPNHQLFT